MAKTGLDPRDIITPDAFSVAPELLGTPLARPWRRGVAMGVDLLLISIIAGLGLSWLLLFIAVTFLAGRAAIRPSKSSMRKGARWSLFGSLSLVAFIAALITGYETVADLDPMSWGAFQVEEAGDNAGTGEEVGFMDAIGTATDVAAIQGADTPAELEQATSRFVDRLERLGAQPDAINEALAGLAEKRDEPWAKDAILSAIDESADLDRTSGSADSLVIAYSNALQSGDTIVVRALRDPLAESFAGERIAALEGEKAELESQLEDQQGRGLIQLLLRILNEVGIDIGWSALFFTLFPVIWKGRTPGKRLMRIRIVRLDGKPIGWWAALNRFGGYAASTFTGLLGFFEMFWDDNRQALQDRIASTVVVREAGTAAVTAAAGETKP
ncbi:MAG TPA: RDD family protein [Gemmatimonadota bacterium]|nr:RDD family protein [Gemmatimonadota bacterium]